MSVFLRIPSHHSFYDNTQFYTMLSLEDRVKQTSWKGHCEGHLNVDIEWVPDSHTEVLSMEGPVPHLTQAGDQGDET